MQTRTEAEIETKPILAVDKRLFQVALRPAIAGLFLYGSIVMMLAFSSPQGFLLFVHQQFPTDANVFHVMTRDPDWGLSQLIAWNVGEGIPYRLQRIAYPLLARIFALNQPDLAPFGLVAANLLALVLGAEGLTRWAIRYGRAAAWGFLWVFAQGVFVAVFFDISEALLWAALIWTVLLLSVKRVYAAAFFLTLALFTKETALIFVCVFGLAMVIEFLQRHLNITRNLLSPFSGNNLTPAHVFLIALPMISYGLYQAFLFILTGNPGLLDSAKQLIFIPFAGAVQGARGNTVTLIYLSIAFVVPVVLALGWSLRILSRGYDVLALALTLNCVQVAFMAWMSWSGFIHYGRLAMGVPLIAGMIALRSGSRRTLFLLVLLTAIQLVPPLFGVGA